MNNGNSKISAFFARIEGRVQGVGFRYSCAREGKALGLSGWVRNTNDGDVEVWAEGRREKLDALAEWLKRGPPSARVIRKSGLIPQQTFGLRSAPAERKQRHDKIWY